MTASSTFLGWLFLALLVLELPTNTHGFAGTATLQRPRVHLSSSTAETTEASWENLVPDDPTAPVRKTLIQAADAGSGVPAKGSRVAIRYTGRLLGASSGLDASSWDTATTLHCWLSEQQGVSELLSQPFRDHSVDGATLLDEEQFTEDFVANTLGVANKIQCKKTVMAARRLRKTMEDHEEGSVFDARSEDDEPYSFVLGAGKTIRAMELLVATMAVGETALVEARCDYGYGSDGFATRTGDVLVPPFGGLSFEVTLLSAEEA